MTKTNLYIAAGLLSAYALAGFATASMYNGYCTDRHGEPCFKAAAFTGAVWPAFWACMLSD